MAKHLPSVTWCTSLAFDKPYQMVQTEEAGRLKVSFMPGMGKDGISITLKRSNARLLAKRINQCLDYTLSKPRKAK